jgi:hypothetical protein
MGWTHLEGAPPGNVTPTDPAASGRGAFSEVFLDGWLRSQVFTLNRDGNGKPWLDEQRLDQSADTGGRGRDASTTPMWRVQPLQHTVENHAAGVPDSGPGVQRPIPLSPLGRILGMAAP